MSKLPFAEMMRVSEIMIQVMQASSLRALAVELAPNADETMTVSDFIELLNMRADALSPPRPQDGEEHHMEPPC